MNWWSWTIILAFIGVLTFVLTVVLTREKPLPLPLENLPFKSSNEQPFPYSLQATLVGTGYVGSDVRQGDSGAISGDGTTAAVGSIQDDANNGAVWIFVKSGSTWTQQGSKLTPSDATGVETFAISVSLSTDGNTLLVGGSTDDSNTGAIWAFTRSGTTWSQQGNKMVPSAATSGDSFGTRVALSGDGNTAVAGAPNRNSNEGAVWVFTRSGSMWSEQDGPLVGSGALGSPKMGLRIALSQDGNTLVTSGFNDNTDVGAVWVFTRSGSSWSQQGSKLTSSGGYFGVSIALALDGDTMVATTSDALVFFTRSGSTWSQSQRLTWSDQSTGSGSIALRGTKVLMGNGTYLVGITILGAVHVFENIGGVWGYTTTITAGLTKMGGGGLQLTDDAATMIIGSPVNVGAAYIYA